MKKYLLRIILSLFLAFSFTVNADATVLVRGATAITGGASGSLDSLDGASLNDGDVCFVFYGTSFYFYKLDADSGLAESSPSVISPDTNAGTKRWILQGTTISDFAVGSDADGDVYYRSSGALARLAKGTAGQTLQMNGTATAPAWATYTPTAALPLGHLSGLTLSHAADTEHDITVAAGKARDATDAADIALAAAITKQLDAAWSVGSAAGGFAAGESLPASGTIHVWLIYRSDTGVVDVMANNNATSGLTPTLPADYDYKRLIGSYRTDASNNIINGVWYGSSNRRKFVFNTQVEDYSAAPGSTDAFTVTCSSPTGIETEVVILHNEAGGAAAGRISSLASVDLSPATDAYINFTNTIVSELTVRANTSSQFRCRLGANVSITLSIVSYTMDL